MSTPRSPGQPARIYAAHPITTYGTGHEQACLNALAALLPAAEIINPAGRYRSSASWLRAWPRMLSTLAGLVVFGDEEGTVGVGCLREVADAIRVGVPVAVLHGEGSLFELARLDVLPADERSAFRAARLVSGEACGWPASLA